MSNSSDLKRATGLLVIEVRNSNPNGDPDREGEPRQRRDGRGLIAGVSFKRKLRDLVEMKDGPVWCALSDELGLAGRDDGFRILESRGRRRREIWDLGKTAFQTHYWDARVFGNTFLESFEEELAGPNAVERQEEGEKTSPPPGASPPPRVLSAAERREEREKREHFIRTGVAQFPVAVSVAPVVIEKMTNTNKAGVQEGKDRGMAPLGYRVVQHGVYCMPFFVNPTSAVRSGCRTEDIALLKRLIPYAYPHTASHVRPCVEIRHAWYVEHSSPLGSCSDFAILDALSPRKSENPDKPSTSWEEYDVPTGLCEDLIEKRGLICSDLMAK